ncbi:hypothetical protein HHI36_013040 [Cryptolaemus montrouzieri]|uniref:Uncharacterized protein n=1 Tax=Cryptolaemus montrouzieri TaxID=559131 RepID=A0ABD2NG61_9CUCU
MGFEDQPADSCIVDDSLYEGPLSHFINSQDAPERSRLAKWKDTLFDHPRQQGESYPLETSPTDNRELYIACELDRPTVKHTWMNETHYLLIPTHSNCGSRFNKTS